jgi:hypothetical protein
MRDFFNIYVVIITIAFSTSARAEMVSGRTIGNDPAKEKLCVTRSLKAFPGGASASFEIDSGYVERSRQNHSDSVFVAIDGDRPQLVECYLREGTGKFEPAKFVPEDSYWRLIKPERFQPDIQTDEGKEAAFAACEQKFKEKNKGKNFDHNSRVNVREVSLFKGEKKAISGVKPLRFDIVVDGKAFFKPAKSNSPDLDTLSYKCVFTPMLVFKAIQIEKN